MSFLTPYIPYIIEGAVLLLVYYIFHKITSKKSNLMYYLTSGAVFEYPGLTAKKIGTHTITIKNFGKGKAEDIQICHGKKLAKIVVYPDLKYKKDRTPQGSKIIKFDELAPKSSIVISYMYNIDEDMAQYLIKYVKSKDGEAKNIQAIQYPIYPKIYTVIVYILMLSGLAFLLILLYELIKAIF